MRLVGLISGGKDSVFNMLQCIAAGHEIVAVANIEPAVHKNEMDSYMYQTVGHQTLSLLSAAISLPIYRHKTKGVAICQEKVYVETPDDEVEDLYRLISKIKEELHIDGVSVGAIESDYQRTRVENICTRLNLKCFAYLWKRDQEELLQEMIDAELDAIVVKVAALGLEPEAHLGARIKDLQSIFVTLNRKFGVNICGEGGEYETLTVDCPLYHRKIEIIESEKIIHSDDAFAPVGILSIKNAKLESKTSEERRSKFYSSPPARLDYVKNVVKPPSFYVQDCTGAMSDEKISSSSSELNEILPFPFGSQTEVAGSIIESKTALSDHLKSKSVLATNPIYSNAHTSHTTFSPSSAIITDTSVIQLNHSTGWCCIGNVSASSVKEGLTFIQKHLERFQYLMRDVVAITLYVRDMGDWSKINKTYSQSMPAFGPPTRGCVAVPLPPDVAVVMTVVAHRLVSRTQKVIHYTQHTVDKEFIHVQSISHWAPANIGPYSQCMRVGEIVYVAGQIPLIPGTMELLNRPIPDQCRLALRHVSRILKAVNEMYTMANVMHGVCFVTREETAAEILGLWNYIAKNEHAAIAVVVVLTLPKNASLEWLVLGCGYDRPEVLMGTNKISEEFLLRHKRCFYVGHNTAAMVCNVSFAKKQPRKVIAEKSSKAFTSENVMAIMKQCVQILRGDLLGSGTFLCMFTIYYKASEKELAQIVNELCKSSFDFKVVVTPIPVLACEEPSTLLTITGVCH